MKHVLQTIVSEAETRSLHGPIGGAYLVVTPTLGDTTSLDLSRYVGKFVRITSVAEDLYYVFSNSPDATAMVGMHDSNGGGPDYKLVFTEGVPDVIGCGSSVREIVPLEYPYLHLRSMTGQAGEVRIRRA